MACKRFSPRFLMSMGSLSFILLFSCSVTGDESCNQVILVDKAILGVSTRHSILPSEIDCPKNKGGRCEATYRGKTELLRSSTKLCAVGNYVIFCKYGDSISINSSTDNYTLPCDPIFYNRTHEIDVCAPTGEDLRMTFQSTVLCENSRRTNPVGKIILEQKQLYNHPMYLSRTRECHRSGGIVTGEAEGIILSGRAAGDPSLYFCVARINVQNSGHNKICLTFVEFTTPKDGPALKISGGKEDLVYSNAKPVPTKDVCLSLKEDKFAFVFSVERSSPDKTLDHKFIIKYKTMKSEEDDDDGNNKLLWLLVIPAIIVLVVVGYCIWRKRSKY